MGKLKLLAIAIVLFLSSSCDVGLPMTGGGGGGGKTRNALFATSFLVHGNEGAVRDLARKIAKSPHYSAVMGVLDLGDRGFVFAGRNQVDITPQAINNINIFKSSDVRPIVIVRNDWAARNGRSIPSSGRVTNANFYTPQAMTMEKTFIANFTSRVNGVDIMYAFEANSAQSVEFYLELIKFARGVADFSGNIYVNFIGEAAQIYAGRQGDFARYGVISAPSQNFMPFNFGAQVVNTDGNMQINSGNVQNVIKDLKAGGKPYFLWSSETRWESIPDAYF